jgi:hypothetical protein
LVVIFAEGLNVDQITFPDIHQIIDAIRFSLKNAFELGDVEYRHLASPTKPESHWGPSCFGAAKTLFKVEKADGFAGL